LEGIVADAYDKDIAGVMLDYMPSDIGDYAGTDFDLRITFGDDPLDTAFWVTIPGAAQVLTLRQLVQQYVMGESREDRERITANLDTESNPDLPSLYLAVRRAFDDMAKGRAIVRFYINKGPADVNLDDPVTRHFNRAYSQQYDLDYRLIDLVLDVTDLPRLVIPPQQQAEQMREFRLILLLYLMDRYGRDFVFEGQDLDVTGIEAVADWAVTKGWLDLSAKDVRGEYKPVYSRTEQGNKLLRSLVRETDDLIKNYDQFGDVTLTEEPPRFQTGRGEDLRIWVYQAENVDPLRAAFLMNIENGLYDHNWRQVFRDDAFYRELIMIAGAESPVTAQKLDRIIRAGRQWAAERRDQVRRSSRAADLWDYDRR
jgi:hypothetical protein